MVKKTHTVKNLLIISTIGTILWLGQTVSGKIHDKKLAQQLQFSTPIHLLADLGFLGWKADNVELTLPHKKPKNTKTEKKELTQEQKDWNQKLASRRVKRGRPAIENVLAHIKVLRIIKDRNRNYKVGFRQAIMRIACALYNFRQAQKIKL